MALKTEMTWEPKTSRWKKVHHGRTYLVSCRQLGTPETKEASYTAANAWWRAKRFELDASASAAHPHAARLAELDRRRAWAEAHGGGVEAQNLAAEHRRVEGGGEPADPHEVLRAAWRALYGGDPPAPERLSELFGTEAAWVARGEGAPPVEPDRTVGGQVARYLDLEYRRHQAGGLSAGEFDVARRSLHMFRDWLGAGASVDHVDPDRWEDWHSHLVDQPLSIEVKRKRLRFARQFIVWLASRGKILLPPNLAGRRNRFEDGEPREIKTVPVGEVRAAIAAAQPPLDVFLMLMCNCGFTQVDLSLLKQSQLDWSAGTLRHRRRKTARYPNVPWVNYRLWPETLALLEPYRAGGDDLVFRTRTGRPLVHDRVSAEGRRGKSDAVRLTWERVRRKTGVRWQLKLIRKTSATLIESHQIYGRLTAHFLGHSPETMADRHYAQPPQQLFDEAVRWLGEQFGFGPGTGGRCGARSNEPGMET